MEQEDAQSPLSYQNLKSPENIWILLHFSDSFIDFFIHPFWACNYNSFQHL